MPIMSTKVYTYAVMMEIPFHKIYITEEEVVEVIDTLRSGWLTMGPKTIEFEHEFSRYIGSANSISLNSGTSALHLALKAVNLNEGEEVIVPTMTFTATAEVVCYFKAKPVLVDTDRWTNNINVSGIEKAITPKTRAIIPVHFGGQACDMDAAHSLPASYKGRAIGTIGDLTCFSFYATKPLSTGEGGMVTTENEEWGERIRLLRLHGISKDAWKRYTKGGSWFYEVIEAGFKYNMTDIQAALGLCQLRKIGTMWTKRKYIAEKYNEAFSDCEALIIPCDLPDRISSYHIYSLKLRLESLTIDRSRFIDELGRLGVRASVHFIPLHRHPFYLNTFNCEAKNYPGAQWAYDRLVSLPIYPSMEDQEIEYVIDSVKEISAKYSK